jgi:hypothetical protein
MPTALDKTLPYLLRAQHNKMVNKDLYYQDFTHCAVLKVPTFPPCLSSNFLCCTYTSEWETESLPCGNDFNCTDLMEKCTKG